MSHSSAQTSFSRRLQPMAVAFIFAVAIWPNPGDGGSRALLRLDRLRLRGPCGAHDEFLLAATAQNLRKLAKLIPTPAPMPA